MCGISGCLQMASGPIDRLTDRLTLMNHLLRHRGPDGKGVWASADRTVGLAHRRLSIIDLTDAGKQPMSLNDGSWITYNGEIYNYIELRQELGEADFVSGSDTEVVLRAYQRWGADCVNHLRGMFAFAIWDARQDRLFCSRDRFGIKPFYYMTVDGVFYFASEVKALLPFVHSIETNIDGLQDYLTFQFCLGGKTLFKGINELSAAHVLIVKNGDISVRRYWELKFRPDWDHTAKYFEERTRALLKESIGIHLRSDVAVGAYVSGGLDSSAVASIAMEHTGEPILSFTGKFSQHGEDFDESEYARHFCDWKGTELLELDITASDFCENLPKVMYHLDYPLAGPGSFSQYMVSGLAAEHRKVVLGGQGGDEIFGGYTRYLIAYFEQCIKAAIDGTMNNGKFIVTYESIIKNLSSLRNYKPLLQYFWQDGLFESMDKRYFRLINRAPDVEEVVNRDVFTSYSPFASFCEIFNGNNLDHSSYFDLMTHLDFKTLLPALLHIEDRVSMAHSLESRVPLLDHPLIELSATIPANFKFRNGELKYIFKKVITPFLPEKILHRTDKKGFPTPVNMWFTNEAKDYIHGIFTSSKALGRGLIDNQKICDKIATESQFGRKTWGLLCIELWHQTFHDKQPMYRRMLDDWSAGVSPSL